MIRRLAAVRPLAFLAAGGAVGIALSMGWGHPSFWALPVLAGLVTLSEFAVVHFVFGRQRWALSLTEATIAAAIALAPGGWTVFGVALGVLVAQVLRRRPMLKLQFNVGQFALTTAITGEFAHMLGGSFLAVGVAMAVFWLVNYLLVAVAVALTSRQTLRELLRGVGPLSGAHSVGNSSMGLLAAFLAVNAPLGLLALATPLFLMWNAYEQGTRRAAEARLFAELVHGQDRASGRSTDVSSQAVLSAVARLFGADVEMLVVTGDGAVRYTGDESEVRRSRVESNAFDQPWVLRALGAGAVDAGIKDGRPFCTSVIGAADQPLAVLIARRPIGAADFERSELLMASLLAKQAESWLSVAELAASRDEALAQAEAAEGAARALGDAGAHTAPALGVLRESAARLARLASMPDGPDPVGEIVDELHAVERAVASLLGAIALAADPELRDIGELTDGAEQPLRVNEDWTTTGVLAGAELVP